MYRRQAWPKHFLTSATILLLTFQNKRAEAEPLYKRSLSILERTLDSDHPAVATSLNSLADTLLAQVSWESISRCFTFYIFHLIVPFSARECYKIVERERVRL